jgi:TonB-dependent receptor
MIIDLYRFGNKLAFLFLFILVFILQTSILAQSGSIKGVIFDKESKEPLVGANVIVKGTSLGAASDLDGNYVIQNVPVGRRTFLISYIGYSTDTVVVNISASKEIVKNFYLSANSIQGQTIVITGQAQGQVSAIQQQLSSNTIVNVVSEEKIQELPDFNAAAALGRLPGVSTLQSSGEADKVVIRGIAPQFNEVSIGGITLAATGNTSVGITSLGGYASSTDRSVDLTSVTPYMIKDIQVYKALLPDMEANAVGGFVNMDLRQAPSGLHGDLLWQSGYTNFNYKYGNYRAVASASDRFFNDMLGVYILGNAESYDRSADNMNASYSTTSDVIGSNGYLPVQVQTVSLDRHIETRNRYGGNVILDYTLPNGSITSINTFNREHSDYQDYTTQYEYTNKEMEFDFSSGNPNTDIAVNSLDLKNDFGFMSIDLKAANSYSRNDNPYSPLYQFTSTVSVKSVPNNVPPEDLGGYVENYSPTNTILDNSNLYNSDYKENDQIYKGDFKIPLNIENTVSGFVKFGGEFRFNLHENYQNTPYIQLKHVGGVDSLSNINDEVDIFLKTLFPQLVYGNSGYFTGNDFMSSNAHLTSSFLNNKFGSMLWAADGGFLNQVTNAIADNPLLNASNPASGATGANPGGWQDGPYQEYPNQYTYIERYYGTYLMSELDFGQELMVVGGARYEENNGQYQAWNLVDSRNPQTQTKTAATGYTQNHFWLPQAQVKYTPFEWMDVRYAYTQTLARPNFTDISPHFVASNGFSEIYSGNPNLLTAQSYNHDLEITFHNNTLGLFTIGGFYKLIKNFAYATSYTLYKSAPAGFDSLGSFPSLGLTGTAPTINTYINDPELAYVRGIETDYQTRLWYLPFPFDGTVIGINYTHIASATGYPVINTIHVTKKISEIEEDFRTSRLEYQPNDIANAYIGYDYKGFQGRISFLFQGNSVSYIGAFPEDDGFTKDYFRIDASFKQELPINGLDVYLDLNNLNSEANISAQKSIGGFTSENYYGMTADLGIRYRL